MGKKDNSGFEDVHRGYWDDAPTAFIDAVFKNGRFSYLNDPSKEVELQEGSLVRITVPKYSIPNQDRPDFHRERRQVLDKHTRLYFTLTGNNLRFEVILLEDLYLIKDENKFATAESSSCVVIKMQGKSEQQFSVIEASSFNQAYFKTSLRYKPNANSHTCNIYKRFKVRKNISLIGHPIDLDKLNDHDYYPLVELRF